MSCRDPSVDQEVRRALEDLRTRTAASLQAFNDEVPYGSWLRRSEIKRLTVDLLQAAERVPQRRGSTPFGKIKNAFSWITRVRTAA